MKYLVIIGSVLTGGFIGWLIAYLPYKSKCNHNWSKWKLISTEITYPTLNKKSIASRQVRVCTKCGEIQSKGV